HAVWKAFKDLERTGLVEETPRMVGVQAEGCNTVVKALEKGFEEVEPVEEVDTVAGAIACADPLDGEEALNAVKESGGQGVAVSDREIMEAKRKLAEKEGVYAEEAGAASVAGVKKLGGELEGEKVVAGITGHGLKT
ncbi:MAG: pyridoxal-phosphate dependent enzyme, partial [Candidatus Nanohaloarchaea archaeon]